MGVQVPLSGPNIMNIHQLLKRLHEAYPTPDGVKHNITLNKDDKLEIAIWRISLDAWTVIVLDPEDEVKSYGRLLYDMRPHLNP